MTSPVEPSAILTGLIVLTTLISLLKKADPAILISRWLYATRRAIFIAGSMLWDAPGEAAWRWRTQRPRDVAALNALDHEFPVAGDVSAEGAGR